MTLPFNLFQPFTDRTFGSANPLDTRSPNNSHFSKPLPPIKVTAKRPSWRDITSGKVDQARAAVGARTAPTPQEIAEQLRTRAREAYASTEVGPGDVALAVGRAAVGGVKGAAHFLAGDFDAAARDADPKSFTPRGGEFTRRAFRGAAYGDLATAGAMSAFDPTITADGVGQTVQQFAAISDDKLGTTETLVPMAIGALAGNVAAFMTGSRAATKGAEYLGREFGMAQLANAGKTLEEMRNAKSALSMRAAIKSKSAGAVVDAAYEGTKALARRGVGELLPAIPINAAQGMMMGDEGGSLTVDVLRKIGLNDNADFLETKKGRLFGAAENIGLDAIGFSALEGLRGAVRASMMPVREVVSGVAGAGIGAYTDDEDRVRGALTGGVLGIAGSRADEAVGLSTRIVNGIDVGVVAPFKAYSKGLLAVAESKQTKGDAGFWRATLLKGTRKAELDDTGMLQWLDQQSGTLTREQVAAEMRTRMPELGADDRGVTGESAELSSRIDALEERHRALAAKEAAEQNPSVRKSLRTQGWEMRQDINDLRAKLYDMAPSETQHDSFVLPGTNSDYGELVTTKPPTSDTEHVFKIKDHWPGTENPIAHARVSERVVDGERALVVHDFQSDAHQIARDEGGYRTPEFVAAREEMGRHNNAINEQRLELDRQATARAMEIGQGYNAPMHPDVLALRQQSLDLARETQRLPPMRHVPDLPFKKTPQWTELQLKRVIEEAQQRGIDRVILPTGEQANKMFSLSQAADEMTFRPESGMFEARKGGRVVHAMQVDDPSELHRVIGRELTEKLMAAPQATGSPIPMNVLRGEDLEVGGAGMKAYYDQIVPSTIKDYAKKLGVKIELEKVGAGTSATQLSRHDLYQKVRPKIKDYETLAQFNSVLDDLSLDFDSDQLLTYGDVRQSLDRSVRQRRIPASVRDHLVSLVDEVLPNDGVRPGLIKEKAAAQQAYRRAVTAFDDARAELDMLNGQDRPAWQAAQDRVRAASRAVSDTDRAAKALESEFKTAMRKINARGAIADNLAFRITPEMKAAIKDGQPLWALGAAGLVGDDQRDPKARVGMAAALALGSLSKSGRAARAIRSALGTASGVITQEAQSWGRFGFIRLAEDAAYPSAEAQRALNTAVHAALNPEGEDLVGQIVERVLGRPIGKASARETQGVWKGAFSPNRSIETGADDAATRLRGAILGLVEGQDAVAWHRWLGEKGAAGMRRPENFGIIATGRDEAGLTPSQLDALFQLRADPKYAAVLGGATESDGHLLFRNFDPKVKTSDFTATLTDAFNAAGIAHDLHTGYFAGELLNGTGAYLRALGQDPDALREVRALLSRVEPEYAKFAESVGADAAVVSERFATRARGLEALETQLRAPRPATNRSGLSVPAAMDLVAADVRKQYATVIPEGATDAETALQLEGRLRLAVQQMADDLGLSEAEIRDWYKGGARILRDIASLSLPTLSDDAHWTIFTAVSSVLSSGQKVNDEIRGAMNVWAQFERDGVKGLTVLNPSDKKARFLTGPSGMRGFRAQRGSGLGMGVGGYEPIAMSQRTLNHEAFLADLGKLIEQEGVPRTAALLREGKITVGGKNAREYAIALDALGPKVGQYFLDKLGVGGSGSTIDLWMARLYHVLRGEAKYKPASSEDIIAAAKRLGKREELDLDEDEIAELTAIANGSVGTKIIDDTVTPAMRETMQQVLRGIASDFNAVPSSAQALSWYAIKRMLSRAGAKEDANAYATLASAAADASTIGRTPVLKEGEKFTDALAMGAKRGTEGWKFGGDRRDAFTANGVQVPPLSRRGAASPGAVGALGGGAAGGAAGALLGAQADAAMGQDVSTREGAVAGLLGGLVAGAGGGGVMLHRLPGLLAGRNTTTLLSRSADVAQVVQSIAHGARTLSAPPSIFGDRVGQMARRAYAALVDDVYALRRLGRQVSGDAPLSGLDAQLRQSQRWITWADQRLQTQLRPVLDAARGREQDVMALVKIRRDMDLRAQGVAVKTEFADDVLARARADLEQDQRTVAAADALQDYYRGLLDWKLDENLHTQDSYDAIVASEDFYTPFLREWEQEGLKGDGAGGFVGGGKTYNRGNGTRKLDRQQMARAKTIDPFEIAVMDTQKTAQLVGKQRVMQMISGMVEANGGEIPGVLKRVPKSDSPDPLGRRFDAIVNGQQVTYEVLDPDVFKAIQSFGPKTQVPSILKAIKEFKRAAITTLPDFALRNLIRDNAQVAVGNPVNWRGVAGGAAAGAGLGVASAANEPGDMEWNTAAFRALAGAGVGTGGAVLVPQLARTMRGVTDIMAASRSPLTALVGRTTGGNAAVWTQFLTDGAASIGHYARDLRDARNVLQTLRGDRARVYNPRRWYEALEALGSTLENAPRLATYKTALEGGASRPEAAALAADISLDFSRKGGSPFQQGLNETNAFLNARVQGWDKMGRMLRDPRTWAVGAATLTAPSVGNWIAIHQDDQSRESYYEHPTWVRNTFWLVPTGGGDFLYIPKPFELGTVFASIPERFLDWMYAKQTKADTRPGESAGHTAAELLSSVVATEIPITDALKPVLEQSINYDFFRNRPIVSSETYTSSKTLPEFQTDDRTSKVARIAGERFGWSPQRVDHLIGAYGGSAGKVALRALDEILPGENTSPTAGRMPIVGDLVAGFTDRKGQTSDAEVTVRRRYDHLQRVENALKPLLKMAEDESADPARREAARKRALVLVEQNAKDIGAEGEHLDGLKAANDVISELRDEARAIQRTPGMPAAERKAQLEDLQRARAQVARLAVAGRYDEIEALVAQWKGVPQ